MRALSVSMPRADATALPARLRGDPVRRLLDALEVMSGEGTRATLVASRLWASGMFDGVSYSILLVIPGPMALSTADRLRRTLPEAEFGIGGHIVADVSVDDAYATDDAAVMSLSVLVLREG